MNKNDFLIREARRGIINVLVLYYLGCIEEQQAFDNIHIVLDILNKNADKSGNR